MMRPAEITEHPHEDPCGTAPERPAHRGAEDPGQPRRAGRSAGPHRLRL